MQHIDTGSILHGGDAFVSPLSKDEQRRLLSPSGITTVIIVVSVVVGIVLLSVIGYCVYKECISDRSESRKQKRRLMERENRQPGDISWDDIEQEADPTKKRQMKEQLIVQKSRKKLKFDEQNRKVLKESHRVTEMQYWQDAHAEAIRTLDEEETEYEHRQGSI